MHTDRPALAAQTRPRVSHPTPARRLCVSILRAASPSVPYPPYCQCWDATRRACSALPRQRVRGGIALSRGQYRVPNLEGVLTTKELVPRPVEFLPERHHLYMQVSITESGHFKCIPLGTSNSDANATCLPTLAAPPALASYKNRLRWRMRIGGSASTCTVCVASRVTPGLMTEVTCTDCGEEMYARASLIV